MTYVAGDGSLVERTPWSLGSLFGLIFGFFHGIGMFFNTLIRPKSNKYGDRYTRDYRPGSGPPRPPTRRMGGLNLGPSVSVPGGCSSCAGR
ncbi:selenoprotein K-like [Venturia canescens]|uniref:selenoprotein K-like n=1 Tax=Venturia canescens TaxID=32260 RepID=UPI001C9C4091|nr:selenoprotein K-like [Venturia canescens]